MFIFGSPEQMKERLGAFVEGGVTLPILTPITTPDKLGELIEALGAISGARRGRSREAERVVAGRRR